MGPSFGDQFGFVIGGPRRMHPKKQFPKQKLFLPSFLIINFQKPAGKYYFLLRLVLSLEDEAEEEEEQTLNYFNYFQR